MGQHKPEIVKYMLWGIILMTSILVFAYIAYIIHWAFTYPETPKLIAEHVAAILGLPLGLLVALTSGSPLAGLVSMITAVLIGLLVCRKEIIQEHIERRKASKREQQRY